MITVTVKVIAEKGYKKALLLGSEVTMSGGMYKEEAEKCGLQIESYSNQARIRSIIEAGKTGVNLEEAKSSLLDIIRESNNIYDCVILGCTELPLVISQQDAPFPLIDTSHILALETVKYATI
jgi:aspartate racemase